MVFPVGIPQQNYREWRGVIQRKRWVLLPKAMGRVVRQAKAAAVPWMKKEEEGRTVFSKIVVLFVLEAFPGI